jgi:hypothetical protein
MRFILLFLCLLAAGAGYAQPTFLPDVAASKAYRVVFADDFRYPSRDSLLSPHLQKWAPQHTWGNARWDTATVCKNIDTGNYAYLPEDIRLVPNPAEPNDMLLALDFDYHAQPLTRIVAADGRVVQGQFYKTSGMVRGIFRGDSACTETGFKYGIFEIRCQVPTIDGLQAAFWLWNGADACNVKPANWTATDTWEIDGFETFSNGGQRIFFSTLQANALRQHKPTVTDYAFKSNAGPEKSFHTYTVVWTPRVLAWYVDGKLYKYLRQPKNPAKAKLNPVGIPNTELNLLISSHYQWDCKNNYHCDTLADSTTINDQQCPQPNDPFLIDYIRVYRPAEGSPEATAWPLVEQRRRRVRE